LIEVDFFLWRAHGTEAKTLHAGKSTNY
jgi:hypothetical protein